MNFSKCKKIIRYLCLSLFVLTCSTSWAKEALSFQNAEKAIELGQLKEAKQLLEGIKQHPNLSSTNRYYREKLLCKIYCFEQDFISYKSATEQLVQDAKKLEPIFLAEAFAHKAYYWHYMMWGDSALYYSNTSFELLQNNRGNWRKIEPAFVYEVYAITYLYRRNSLKTNAYQGLGLKDKQRKQFLYFDSCEFIQKQYPFRFSSDRAMFYRSYGNRNLDLVTGYKVFNKEETKKFNSLQWYAYHRANKLYDKGLACIKPWHKNDFLALISLKGMNHCNVGERKKASEIFNTVYERFTIKELMNRQHVSFASLKVFLTFQIRNSILLPYKQKTVDRDIKILRRLKREFWNSFFTKSDLPYDPYKISPYIDLFTLYYFKSQHEQKRKQWIEKAVSHLLTMKSYFHFLQNGVNLRSKKNPFFSVKIIQRALGKNEAYLLYQNDADFLANQKILITKSAIDFVQLRPNPLLKNEVLDSLTFRQYKTISYLDYKQNFSAIKEKLPDLKKLYIGYDDPNPYEIFIQNKKGETFGQLSYLGKDVNFVRIYNPVTYFSSHTSHHFSQVDARYLKQKKGTKLLFTNDFFKQTNLFPQFNNSTYRGQINQLLNQKGILHIYGHGELVLDAASNNKSFQWSYLRDNSIHYVKRLTGQFKVKRDLVVLNQCFSGYPDFRMNEFNKTMPLRIMSNGAKSVISSPYLLDDYFSADFFERFYRGIMNEMLFEDAFFNARKDFFRVHPELNHPTNWNSLQLMESYKLQYKKPIKRIEVISLILIGLVVTLLVLLNVRKKK
jgi:hypothetical protein